jgi:hypothetical protein
MFCKVWERQETRTMVLDPPPPTPSLDSSSPESTNNRPSLLLKEERWRHQVAQNGVCYLSGMHSNPRGRTVSSNSVGR